MWTWKHSRRQVKKKRQRRAKTERRRRRITSRIRRGDYVRPTTIHDVPDDLLELVFLRLRSHLCLYRAAATCKAWRRVIAGDDDGFVHRFRSIHGRRLHLGHYSINKRAGGTRPEFVPSPPQPAIHLRRRVSLDFLPWAAAADLLLLPYNELVLTDSRDGLLAFVHYNRHVIVCNPWTRQYRELDIPWRQLDGDPATKHSLHSLGVFFLATDDDGGGGETAMSSFKVLCPYLVRHHHGCYCETETVTAHARVFSARDDTWLMMQSVSTDVDHGHCGVAWPDISERFLGRAGGFLFWSGDYGDEVLVLDESTGEFVTFTLPLKPGLIYSASGRLHMLERALSRRMLNHRRNLRVVGGGGATGDACFLRIVGGDLEVLELSWSSHGDIECVVRSSVNLYELIKKNIRRDRSWGFMDDTTAAAGVGVVASSPSSTLKFFLDVETMKLRPAEKTALNATRVFPYELPWLEKTIGARM